MAATTEIPLKLLIDTESRKVVFAEAKKDFVDILFGLLQVPVGSMMKILLENEMEWAGSIGKVYKSVIDLDSSYLLHNASKELLLWPEMSSSSKAISIPTLLQSFASAEREVKIETTSNPAYGDQCHRCRSHSNAMVTSSSTSSKPEGFARDMTSYMVMDDLKVKPLSPISTITLLNLVGVKDFSSLAEKDVSINFKKALELVKTSFVSNTVLSDVFVAEIRSDPPVIIQ